MKTYTYGKQHLEIDDYLSVLLTLKSPFLTCGPKVREFEQKICEYTGAKYCVAVNSGTSGLHLAILAAGVKENDEVISRLLKKFDDAFLVYGNSGIPENNDAAGNTSVPCLNPETASVFAEFKEIPVFEKTAYGFHILPDRSNGAGPIWFSLIGKKAGTKEVG